jgi:hypothetical protein
LSGPDLVGFAFSGYDPFPTTGTGQFVGLISDTPFNFVGFGSSGPFGYTLDDLTYTVPEPASLLLLGAGLSGLAAFRSRRRR